VLRPVHLDPSLIGLPLPWDLFSESGVLVAGAGLVIADEAHFSRLIGRPLFRKSEGSLDTSHLLDQLEELTIQAGALLSGSPGAFHAPSLNSLAAAVTNVFRTDPDACLGYLHLASCARPGVIHGLKVMFVSLLLADQLEFSDKEHASLANAALTMNMGDPDLDDRLLDRAAPLSAAEKDRLLNHPLHAVEMLRSADVSDPIWIDAVHQHHENMDGSGYPEGLQGGEISLPARILRVADSYCTRISGRHYRPQKPGRSALDALFGNERIHLDSQIATLLVRRVGLLPPGTLIRLASRETACITRRGRNGGHRFAVSFMDARGRLLEPPRERDLTTRLHHMRAIVEPEPAWPKVDWKRLWGY
jgi:hypothetical protein